MDNETTEYAGFWMRFVAYIIDSFVISFLEFLIVIPLLGVLGYQIDIMEILNELGSGDPDIVLPIVASVGTALSLSVLLITWMYYALLESGPKQGTIGKMALNLKVVDGNGDRISFAIASVRFFSKILSSLFFMIGYIMAAFTPQKQALHDIIAKTFVIQK